MSTYTKTRQEYYQKNSDDIREKRRQKYNDNILDERKESLVRHHKNKNRQNVTSLKYYYDHSSELNKKRRSKT